MSNLSPKAQRLVRVGAKAARPSDVDRGRVFEALRQRLGDAAMLESASATAASGAAGALWLKVSAVTVGLGLLAGALVMTWQPAPSLAPMAKRVGSATPAPMAASAHEQVAAVAEVPALPATSPATSAEAPAPAVRRPTERLTQEVALLSRAASELSAGRASDALKTLDEHRRQFPNGLLVEERRAARAQALCVLGRRSEAELELTRLAQTAPQSIQTARARQVCGIR